jgi:hypothetical protein
MAMIQHSVAVGVFTDAAQARAAISDLRSAGFNDDEIGFLTRARTLETDNVIGADTTNGLVGGGVLGGVLGAFASLLIPGFGPAIAGGILAATLGGAVLGAAAGGIIATLVGLGVSEQDAYFYQRELEAGRTIVTVKSDTAYTDALAILRKHGAYNATTHEGVINPPQTLRP